MKNRTQIVIAATLLLGTAARAANSFCPQPEKDPAWYVESMKTRDQRLEWHKDARFGALVVWGLYTPLAGEWNGEVAKGYSEHIMRSLRIPLSTYTNEVAAQFNPDQFDAEAWVKLCKATGMKYVVPIGKFHDGVAMWPSELDELCLADTASPFQRDFLGELRDACKKHGLRFGLYYSHAQDWAHPGGQRNTWDYPHHPYKYSPKWFSDPEWADHIARSEQYIREKSIPQMLEMIERYDPDLIWFDTPQWAPTYQNQMVLKAMREASPDIVVSGRIGGGYGDYASTCDQPDDIQPFHKKYDAWEGIPTSNLSYGYHAKDRSHKPASFFIELLAKTVEHGGNMMMNIGPMPSGLVDPADVEIFEGIGKWMQVNGEAIYGTTHSPLPPQTFGHVSRKGNRLYLHVTRWPVDGNITLAGLKTPIKSARLLDRSLWRKDTLKVSKAGSNDWKLQGPKDAPDPVNTVVVVETDGEPVGIEDDLTIRLASNIREQRLHAFTAKVEGGLKWGHGSPRDNGVVGWNQKAMESGRTTWTVRVEKPLEFELDLIYVAVEGKHGGSYTVSVGEQRFTAEIETQPKPITDKKVKYIPHTLGKVKLDAGVHQITISGEKLTSKELFIPSSIILRKN